MAYTQAEADLLRSNLAKGIMRGRLGDEEVQFTSPAEMRTQLSIMEKELSGGRTGGMTVSYPKTSRGL